VSSLTALTELDLGCCPVSAEGLQTLSTLTALTSLNLCFCYKVTAAAKQALRTALSNLTIHDL
jgi:hypothetical protein